MEVFDRFRREGHGAQGIHNMLPNKMGGWWRGRYTCRL